MNLFKLTLLNTLYQSIAKIITLICGLYTTAILTRDLSLGEFSKYVILMSVVLQIISFIEWGSGYTTVREVNQKPERQSNILSSLIVLRIVGIISSGFILIFLNYLKIFTYSLSTFLVLLFPITVISLKNYLTTIFHTKQNFIATSSMEIISSLIFTILIVLILNKNSGTQTVFIILSISTIISAILTSLANINQIKFSFKPNFQTSKNLILYSLPIGAHLFVFNIYNRVDTYFLSYYHSEATVAYYGLAYKIYENSLALAAFTMTALYPILARKQHDIRIITRNTFIILLSISSLGAFTIYLFGQWIINFLNPEYASSAQYLKILCMAIPFAYINHLTGFTLTAINKQKKFLLIALVALVLNVSLNKIYVPTYSATASSYITIITELSISMSSLVYLYHVINSKNNC